jgi:hypothetical protein
LRLFPRRAVVAVAALVGGYFVAQFIEETLPDRAPAPGGVSASGAATPSELPNVGDNGDALVARVLATLERWPNLTAKFRQTVRIADEPQAGAGDYWQQGVGNQRRTCWQWQTLIAGEQATFTQIYDRNLHLWTDVRYPGSRTVTRVNIGSLRRELAAATDATGPGGAGPRAAELELLARGGASQLIAELRRWFVFGSPVGIVENGKQYVAVAGQWREEGLQRDWPGLVPGAADAWPAQLPHHVVVKVGREDLFPYVIEYRRGADASLMGDVREANDPLARCEFFDVRWGVVMPDRLFEFTPPEADWHDVTMRVLEQLRPLAAPTPLPMARVEGGWRR